MTENRKPDVAPDESTEPASPPSGRGLHRGPVSFFALTDDSTDDSATVGQPAARDAYPRLFIVPPPVATDTERRTDDTARPAARRRSTTGDLAVIGPARALRSPLTGKESADVGLLTHALVSTHAPLLHEGPASSLLPRMTAMAKALLDANFNRRRVIATEAVSLAYRYLSALAPAPPWRLLGVEYETGRGPVDLAWANSEVGLVFFDELKTARTATRRLPGAWEEQTQRYTAAGRARFGAEFVGVRLLPINAMHLARLSSARKPWARLAPTPNDPFRLGGDR